MSQVTKIKRIVIASVLKPIDDTRMAEKLGQSFSASGYFDVHILGFPTTGKLNTTDTLHYYPLSEKPYRRISWKRLIAPLLVLRKVLSLRPKIFIITTHELLLVAMLAKVFIGCKVIYDVQENYFRNIVYAHSFTFLLRHVLGMWVRFKELVCSPAISLFILAEKCYRNELKFAEPCLIAENKVSKAKAETYAKKITSGYTKLLFSGTLAESTGVFAAIEIGKNLHALDPSIILTIIGSCPSRATMDQVTALSNTSTFIRFMGSLHPIPHDDILREIHSADFGIVYYPDNPSTAGSIPTKLYEYSTLNLPILIHHTDESVRFVEANKAGISLAIPIPYEHLLEQMKAFKPGNTISLSYWEDDFAPILKMVSRL